MDVLRFAHFIALAVVTVRFIPIDWPGLKSRFLKPMIMCGQHSLEIFCLGIFLSFLGHFVTSEVSRSVGIQILISVLGILVMIAVAWLISWYKGLEGRGSGPKPTASDADLAGGEA
jgi:prepilin signal peptidase PulO-like enzyme (type II secretory pathway)